MDEQNRELIRQTLGHLEETIRAQGFTHRQVEEILGWQRGAVAHLLAGRSPLRVEELLEILAAVGRESQVFFRQLLFPGDPGAASGPGAGDAGVAPTQNPPAGHKCTS